MRDRWNLDEQIPRIPMPGVIPRKAELAYGTKKALEAKLYPLEAFPDVLVDPKDYKEVIQHCHDAKIFPMYHEAATWAPPGFSYSQDGLPYCWAWAAVSSFQNTRAVEDKETVALAPVSLGFCVGWRSEGNYLESTIQGMRDVGITPAEYCGGVNSTNRNYRQYEDGWEEARKNYRLGMVWDADCTSGNAKAIQHCVSILSYGRSGFAAWNHLGHAMSVIGVEWDERQTNNLIWIIRNSHGETEPIEMVGNNAIPDEFYGFCSTVLT